MKKPKTELINPVQDLISGNMPGLPQIISNAMPVELPQLNFNQSTIGLFFGNIKIGQLVKAKKGEAELARYSREQVEDKLAVVDKLLTFSAGVADTLHEFEHRKTMRMLEAQERQSIVQIRQLEIQEKQADIYIKTAQAQQVGFEAKLSELDYKVRSKHYKDEFGEE